MKNIVFISRAAPGLQAQWLKTIKNKLINETILLPHEVSDSDAKYIDIAIVANPDPLALARYSHLIWIQSLWAGVENLVADATNQQIKLIKLVEPKLAKTMAESVLSWTLYLQRNMSDYGQQQRVKQWRQLPCIMSEDLRVSVLGAGPLGIAALRLLKHLDYKLSCWSRTPKQLDGVTHYTGDSGLRALLNNTDILINMLPLTEATYHLLNKDLLSQLPKGAKLINFSRAAIIDNQALLKLLDNKHIAHAVLDVFEQEPLPIDNPIWTHASITVLPHISAPTNMDSAAKIVAENIINYRENDLIPKAVDIKQGY